MASDKKILSEAASLAVSTKDNRTFLLGAIGQRADGVFVSSRNIAAPDATLSRLNHAEARLSRKLTPGSTVWVARVSRLDGSWAMAKPCKACEVRLRGAGVARIVYTIGPSEWGVIACES